MESETGGLLADGQLNYILMLLLYSGVGSWLVQRFTRNRADLRRERRIAIRDNLDLLQHMGRMREQLATHERKNSLEIMSTRLTDETCLRIEELNRLAAEEIANPAGQYLILPPPRSPFAVFVSLIFAAALYIAIGALVVVGVAFFDDAGFDPLNAPADLGWTLRMFGFSLAVLAIAFLARLAAYRLYNARTQQMRRTDIES